MKDNMAIKTVSVYECDICSSEYKPAAVSERTPDIVSTIRIDGWYKPESQAVIKCICNTCSFEILKTIRKLENSK